MKEVESNSINEKNNSFYNIKYFRQNKHFHKNVLYYRIIIIILILSGIGNQSFAQNTELTSSNYSLLTDNNIKPSDTNDSKKSNSFFSSIEAWPKEKKAIALNVGALTATAIIGGASWDYYSSSFEFQNEGWFQHDTNYGGADKAGHAFGGYALTSVYRYLYKCIFRIT